MNVCLQLKKKKGKLNEAVKHHWASEAKKLREKIDRLSKDMELSKKTEQKVAEKLNVLTEKISEVEMKLDESCVKYVTLKQRCEFIYIYVCIYTNTLQKASCPTNIFIDFK